MDEPIPPVVPPVTPPAPPVTPPTPPAAPPDPSQLTEEQLKQIEKDTNLDRKQLTAVAVMIQQSKGAPATAPQIVTEIAEERAQSKGRSVIASAGVKEDELKAIDAKVQERLKAATPQDRQSPGYVENLYWVERGKMIATARPAAPPPRVIGSGVDHSTPPEPSQDSADLASLSPEEQTFYHLGGYENVAQYKQFRDSRVIDMSKEQKWKPSF